MQLLLFDLFLRDTSEIIFPKLNYLDSPFLLKDCNKAVERIIKAINSGEQIGLETDHDCDGQTAHAILFNIFVNHFNVPKEKISSLVTQKEIKYM